MQIVIGWNYNRKIDKWVITVFADQACLAIVVRQSEAECKMWAEKNMPILQKGKMPAYR